MTEEASEREQYPHALTLRLTEEAYDALREKAHRERTKISRLIRQAIHAAYGIDVEPSKGKKGGETVYPTGGTRAPCFADRRG